MLILLLSIIGVVLSGIVATWDTIFNRADRSPRAKKLAIGFCTVCFFLVMVSGANEIIKYIHDIERDAQVKIDKEKQRADELEKEKHRTQPDVTKPKPKTVDFQVDSTVVNPVDEKADNIGTREANKKDSPARKKRTPTVPYSDRDFENEPVATDLSANQRAFTQKDKESIADELHGLIKAYHDDNMSIPVIIKTDPSVFKDACELKEFLLSSGFKKTTVVKMLYYELQNGEEIYEVGVDKDAGKIPFVGMFRIVKHFTKDE